MTKVSVIIPIYNVEPYLAECLDSVGNQTLKDIEILCIDDCSTDESLKILTSYAECDSRIRILKNDIRKGAGASRNLGIGNASGEYLLFLDSDDWIDLNACKTLYDTARSNDLEITIMGVVRFREDGSAASPKKIPQKRINTIVTGRDLLKSHDFDSSNSDKFWKRDFFVDNDLFNEEGVCYEDLVTTCKALLIAKKVLIMDKSLYYYRCRQDSISRTAVTEFHLKSREHVSDFLISFIEDNDFWKQNKVVLRLISRGHVHYSPHSR